MVIFLDGTTLGSSPIAVCGMSCVVSSSEDTRELDGS
jgi:hypothetical protein